MKVIPGMPTNFDIYVFIRVRLSLCHLTMSISVMEENPPLSVVQRFVHLLDARDVDYSEEIGIYYNQIICLLCV